VIDVFIDELDLTSLGFEGVAPAITGRPSGTYRPANAGTYTDEGMGPLMAAAHPDAFTLIDRSASVAAGSCSASATKPSTPTWCAPSTASTRASGAHRIDGVGKL